MSDILERTLSTLPRLLVGGLAPAEKERGGSRAFRQFLRSIGNVKSKHDEESLVKKELSLLKQKLAMPKVSSSQRQEILMRLVYCHMLAYDVSFAYIHAVKQAQQGTVLEKKVGYLTCALFFDASHEFVVLLINTIQKDLQSSNVLEVCMALTATIQLVSTEMIPALLPSVQDRLSHPKEIVRRKAVMCLHRFQQMAPEVIDPLLPVIHKALCDKHPSVMWAALYIYQDLSKGNPSGFTSLIPGLISVLTQILNRKLSPDYEFHTVPAPWLTVQILKLMAKLGANNPSASEKMYPILKEVLQRTEPSHKIGLAVIYECLETIAAISPHNGLLELATKCVSRFLSATNLNLKYLGVKILTSLVAVNPHYAVEHQSTVLDCLEHPDASIRSKTLELLHRMAQPGNVAVICQKLMDHFQQAGDVHFKTHLLHRVNDLTQRFASDLQWYVTTSNRVLLSAEDLVATDAASNLLMIIQKGLPSQAEPKPPNAEDQSWLLKEYFTLLRTQKLPPALLQVAAWVLGEYSQVGRDPDPSQVLAVLRDAFCFSDSVSQSYILSAFKKQALHIMQPENLIEKLRSALTSESSYAIHQGVSELQAVCKAGASLQAQLSPQTRIPKAQLDLTLSFLDEFVSDALENGAQPYNPMLLKMLESGRFPSSSQAHGLQFTPYDTPQQQSLHSKGRPGPGSSDSWNSPDTDDQIGLNLGGVRSVWSKEGIIKPQPPAPPILAESIDEKSIQEPPQEQMSERDELASALFGPVLQSLKSDPAQVPTKPTSVVYRVQREDDLTPDSVDSLMSHSLPPAPLPLLANHSPQTQSLYMNTKPDSFDGTFEKISKATNRVSSDTESFCDSLASDLSAPNEFNTEGELDTEVFKDSCVHVRLKRECDGVLLTLENISEEELTHFRGATLQLKPPAGVTAQFMNGESSMDLAPLADISAFMKLPIHLRCSKPQPGFIVMVHMESGDMQADLSLELSALDCLRPHAITLQEFNSLWASYTAEKVIQISAACRGMDPLSALTSSLHFHPVSSADAECRLSALWSDSPLLMHLAYHSNTIDISFRTRDEMLEAMEAVSRTVLNGYS